MFHNLSNHEILATWTSHDATIHKSHNIKILLLGSLRWIGRGWTFNNIEDAVCVQRQCHRQFFNILDQWFAIATCAYYFIHVMNLSFAWLDFCLSKWLFVMKFSPPTMYFTSNPFLLKFWQLIMPAVLFIYSRHCWNQPRELQTLLPFTIAEIVLHCYHEKNSPRRNVCLLSCFVSFNSNHACDFYFYYFTCIMRRRQRKNEINYRKKDLFHNTLTLSMHEWSVCVISRKVATKDVHCFYCIMSREPIL